MDLKPNYKKTEIGPLPTDWRADKLGQHARFRTGPFGSALHKSDYTNGGVPVVNPMHIVEAALIPTATMTITESAAAALAEFRLQEGDVIIGRRGDMGRCAVVLQHQAGWLCGTGSMIVRCANTVAADFVQRVLSSPRAVASITESSVGSTMVNLNQGVLSGLIVQVPPLPEQRAIAAALGDVDALLASLDKLIEKKRDLKQAAMQQLLTGSTRLPGFGGNWELRRLGELVTKGPTNGYSGRSGQGGRGTLTLRLTATTSGRMVLDEDTVKRLDETIPKDSDLFLQPGDLLIQRANTLELVGTAAVFDGPANTYVYPDLMSRLRFTDEATARWVWRYANSPLGRQYFSSAAAGSTGSMPKVTGLVIRQMRVPVPTVAEREAIVRILADMDAELAGLETRREKTRAIKQGMMQELLTGRTRLV